MFRSLSCHSISYSLPVELTCSREKATRLASSLGTRYQLAAASASRYSRQRLHLRDCARPRAFQSRELPDFKPAKVTPVVNVTTEVTLYLTSSGLVFVTFLARKIVTLQSLTAEFIDTAVSYFPEGFIAKCTAKVPLYR